HPLDTRDIARAAVLGAALDALDGFFRGAARGGDVRLDVQTDAFRSRRLITRGINRIPDVNFAFQTRGRRGVAAVEVEVGTWGVGADADIAGGIINVRSGLVPVAARGGADGHAVNQERSR